MLRFLKDLFADSAPAPAAPAAPPPTPRPATPKPPRPIPSASVAPDSRAVADARGVRKPLGAVIARGGEGTIHATADRPDVLVKIYHHEILRDRSKARRLEDKITLMAAHRVLSGHPRLAWPRVPLFSAEDGAWCGYAMHRREGVSLRELCGNPRNFGLRVPSWHRQHLVRLCVDFLDTIDTLGRERTLPVDFNPSNFLVDPAAVRLHFIDCDSYQFASPEGIHLSQAIMPELAPPEVIRRGSPTEEPVNPHSLRFSVGMTLFYILNLGNSPYRHINGKDPVNNLLNGACALGRDAGHRFPRGSAYRVWSHLIYDLKDLFIRCFREGHSNPVARPTNTEWRTALLKYNHCLRSGHADPSPIPDSPKSSY